MFAVDVNFNRPFCCHSTISVPAFARTVTFLSVFPVRIDATVAPHEPVPDALEWPTPRSQNRTSISLLFNTRMSSTLVRFGKAECRSSNDPIFSTYESSSLSTNTEQCGFPVEQAVIANDWPSAVRG